MRANFRGFGRGIHFLGFRLWWVSEGLVSGHEYHVACYQDDILTEVSRTSYGVASAATVVPIVRFVCLSMCGRVAASHQFGSNIDPETFLKNSHRYFELQ